MISTQRQCKTPGRGPGTKKSRKNGIVQRHSDGDETQQERKDTATSKKRHEDGKRKRDGCRRERHTRRGEVRRDKEAKTGQAEAQHWGHQALR